jgi:hypothetical protein
VRRELAVLARANAERVGRHLVAAARLIDDDPAAALAHARAARDHAGRIGAVREATGVSAYRAGEYAEALTELRAARRITGRADLLALEADSERAVGHPERALALARSPAAAGLEVADRVELAIVTSGARRDLGQPRAAVLALQACDLDASVVEPWSTRLWYAYAAALLDAGEPGQARDWFLAVAAVDEDEETDAAERARALATEAPPS